MGETITLEWNPNFILKWSDFQAESNPAVFEDSSSVVKYRFTWVINSDKINNKVIFLIEDIDIFVDFHPVLSWVRQSEVNDTLLNHEQGKFDLAELLKHENISKLRAKFYNNHFPTRGQNEEQCKQFSKEDSGKMINREIEKLQKLFNDKCLKYHEETNYGKNQDVQLKYDQLAKQIK